MFKGGSPSTPCGSTFGTTPPGYLLSATPSVGSHGTVSWGTGGLLPPRTVASPAGSSSLAPPFVRPLGFAGQAQPSTSTSVVEAHEPCASGQPARPSDAIPPQPVAVKPSLDLLHSSPFHHPVVHVGGGVGGGDHPSPHKDGLSSFLQAEETASMEAATTFINDFYHHHYPMASACGLGGGGDTMAMACSDDNHHLLHHHNSSLFVEGCSSSAAFLEQHDELLLQAEDMPFAVEGLSSGVSPSQGHASLGSLRTTANSTNNTNEASLMVASMGMVPQKKLALFESNSDEASHRASNDVTVDSLTDQLAGFRSFGTTLLSPPTAPLAASVGSGG